FDTRSGRPNGLAHAFGTRTSRPLPCARCTVRGRSVSVSRVRRIFAANRGIGYCSGATQLHMAAVPVGLPFKQAGPHPVAVFHDRSARRAAIKLTTFCGKGSFTIVHSHLQRTRLPNHLRVATLALVAEWSRAAHTTGHSGVNNHGVPRGRLT